MRKNKNTSKIILAIIVAGLATMISYTAFSNMHNDLAGKEKLIELMQNTNAAPPVDSFAYAVSTKDLKAGELVADDEVDFKQFTQKDPKAFENRSDIVNKVLLQDLPMGATFTTAQIAKVSGDSVSLKSGYRSLTLPAENFQGKSNKMVAGSSVDIFSAGQETDWALDNIKILSFEGSTATTTEPTILDATSINFEVPVDSIADFISSISKSKLVLVARNPNDKRAARKKSRPSSGNSSYGGNSMGSLPNLPSTVPIGNLPGGDLSGLPMPIKPSTPPQEVEMIEANVKSKVTFD